MLFFTKKKTRKSFTIAAVEATNCLTFITYFPLGEGSIFLDPMIQVVGRENLFTTHFTSCPKPQDDTPRSHLSEKKCSFICPCFWIFCTDINVYFFVLEVSQTKPTTEGLYFPGFKPSQEGEERLPWQFLGPMLMHIFDILLPVFKDFSRAPQNKFGGTQHPPNPPVILTLAVSIPAVPPELPLTLRITVLIC